MKPADAFDLCLTFLPDSIAKIEEALDLAKSNRWTGVGCRNIRVAITWLHAAETQLATAERAARSLGLIPNAAWCGVGRRRRRQK